MTTWPSGSKASTANLDSGTDKPRLARPDIKQNVDNVNDIIDIFNIASPQNKQFLKYNSSNSRFELTTILDTDGLEISDNVISATRSNDNIVLKASGTGEIIIEPPRLPTLEHYKEKIITSGSTSGSITIDCNTSPVHIVNQNDNTTYTFSNLGTGQAVTLIIKTAASNKTATFTSDGSTKVKFPDGDPVITQTTGAIDVVVVFNDGTDFLGSITQNYTTG